MEKEDGSDGVKTKRKRGPRRCRRCPGNPLQTECPEHGAKHARMRRLRKQQHTPVDPPSQVPSQELVPETRQQNEQAPAPNEPDRTSPPPNTHSSAPPQAPAPTEPDRTSPSPNAHSFAPPSPVIDPLLIEEDRLLSLGHGATSSVILPSGTFEQASTPGPSSKTPDMMSSDEINGSAPGSPTTESVHNDRTDSTGTIKARVRPSRSNPAYGLVDGVLRGTAEWKIPRVRPRKSILPENKIHKRFDEKTAGIVTRCEELGNETGAWVYFSAHCPGTRHGAVQYFSKRFRKEAPTGVEELATLSGKVFKALINSRRRDVVQAELEVARLRAQAEASQAAVASSKAEVDALTRTNEVQSQIISKLHKAIAPGLDINTLLGEDLHGLIPLAGMQNVSM